MAIHSGTSILADYDGPALTVDNAARLELSDEAWDAFVAASAQPTPLQTTAWAHIKRANGWRALRVALQAGDRIVGAQMLVRCAAGSPTWSLGYVGRGPLSGRVTGNGGEIGAAESARLDAAALGAFTEKVGDVARRLRLAYVRIEPDLDADDAPVLRRLGWRPAPHGQPESTQIIELARPIDELWADVDRKARQSVNKARRLGITVVEADGSRVSDFYRIHVSAAQRAGIVPRAESTYRQMWDVLAPRGMARLLFAERESSAEAVATLFLVSCSKRVLDLYGGTTGDGDATRANYVLKWEAIQRSWEAGFTEYDLWGLPHAGIARFKKGFGGREVRYVGAWDLVTDRAGSGVGSARRARRAAMSQPVSGERVSLVSRPPRREVDVLRPVTTAAYLAIGSRAALRSSARTPVCSYEVVTSYPHDREAYTQGLTFADGRLFEGTGLVRRSSVREVDLDSGQVVRQLANDDEHFGEGIAIIDERLFQLTWRSQKGFIYDVRTFATVGEFEYEGEGWGLTHDGRHLVMSDGTAQLRFLDPDSLVVLRTLEVHAAGRPVDRLNELQYIDGEIFANVWQTDRIARIDPRTGELIAWIDLTGLLPPEERTPSTNVLNGTAFDAQTGRLFVTGKFWPRLYEIRLVSAAGRSAL